MRHVARIENKSALAKKRADAAKKKWTEVEAVKSQAASTIAKKWKSRAAAAAAAKAQCYGLRSPTANNDPEERAEKSRHEPAVRVWSPTESIDETAAAGAVSVGGSDADPSAPSRGFGDAANVELHNPKPRAVSECASPSLLDVVWGMDDLQPSSQLDGEILSVLAGLFEEEEEEPKAHAQPETRRDEKVTLSDIFERLPGDGEAGSGGDDDDDLSSILSMNDASGDFLDLF